ncbi:uncharacterized protein HD556DRAFT_1214862, partial [Suillus plorans]
SGSVSKYTPEAHPALVAMRCVINKRPFKFAADLLHIEAVKLLRPGVIALSPHTVSCDIDETYR